MVKRKRRNTLQLMKLRAIKLKGAITLNQRDINKSRYKSRSVRLSGPVQQSIKLKHFWEDKYNELMTAIAFLEGKIKAKDYCNPI